MGRGEGRWWTSESVREGLGRERRSWSWRTEGREESQTEGGLGEGRETRPSELKKIEKVSAGECIHYRKGKIYPRAYSCLTEVGKLEDMVVGRQGTGEIKGHLRPARLPFLSFPSYQRPSRRYAFISELSDMCSSYFSSYFFDLPSDAAREILQLCELYNASRRASQVCLAALSTLLASSLARRQV